MTVLIVGATGTIGRQIAKEALERGFKIKCLVRNLRKASFLKEWGADLVYGDLSIKQTLPNTLKGITCIIDASTTRPYEFITSENLDFFGKKNLLEAAKTAKIKKYIFLSVLNNHKKKAIPFMDLKLRFEKTLTESGINYTIFYLPSLFQGVISQYAVSILDKQTIVAPKSENKMMYIDARDIASNIVDNLFLKPDENKRIPIFTKEVWTPQQIIQICERFSGQNAKTLYVPNLILKILSRFFSLSEWSWSLAEQLTLVDSNTQLSGKIGTTEAIKTGSLENYLKEYFSVMLKKLKELNIKSSENPLL